MPIAKRRRGLALRRCRCDGSTECELHAAGVSRHPPDYPSPAARIGNRYQDRFLAAAATSYRYAASESRKILARGTAL